MFNNYLIARNKIGFPKYLKQETLKKHLLIYSDNNTIKKVYFKIIKQHMKNREPFVILNNFGLSSTDIKYLNKLYSKFNNKQTIEFVNSESFASDNFKPSYSNSYIISSDVIDSSITEFFNNLNAAIIHHNIEKKINRTKRSFNYLFIFGEYKESKYMQCTFMQGRSLNISAIVHTSETNNTNIFKNVFFNSYTKILLYPYSLKFSAEIIKLDNKKRFINIFSPIYKNNFIISNEKLKVF